MNVKEIQKEKIIEKMRACGCRITKQRIELLDIILENECSSCKEIYYNAVKLNHKIGAATVYRMVNMLEEIGEINRKNMYKVDPPVDSHRENTCVIVLNDHSTCVLPSGKLNVVLQTGLRACGYLTDQKVASVTFNQSGYKSKGL